MRDGGNTTVLKALAVAEGLMPYASKQAYIYRREASGTKNGTSHRTATDHEPEIARCAADGGRHPLYTQGQGNARHTGRPGRGILFAGGATSALVYAGVR